MPDDRAGAAGAAGRAEPRSSDAAPLAPVFEALREHGGLPSAGHALGKLARLLESDTDAIQELANAILADVSLTQRLLRLANTIPYRTGAVPVTTITRAIMLLGFNRVRAATMSLVLLDGILGGTDPTRVRNEFHQALLAGGLARELLSGVDAEEAEEASIAAMFRHVGRLLVAVFAPAALQAVRARTETDKVTESVAAKRALGKSFDELTEIVLRQWSLPDRITAAVHALPPRIEAPRAPAERVRTAAQWADDVAAALGAAAVEPALTQVIERYTPAFAIERSQLNRMLQEAAARTRDFEIACGLKPGDSPLARALEALPAGSQLSAPVVEPSRERDGIGRPANGREILLAGLADATESLARMHDGAGDLGSVIRVALEAIHSGLGFARTALVMRDAAGGTYRTRASFGEPKPAFAFPVQGSGNLFHAALAHASDLYIANVAADKVRASLPDWYARDFAAAKSFLLMPLVLGGRPAGFFYADRPLTDDRGLAPDELNLLRTLRSQVLLAMRVK
jgi:HD-like signal output (HDOD) protein